MPKLSFRLLLGELRRRNKEGEEKEEGAGTESDDGHGDGDEEAEVEVVPLPLPEADLFFSAVYPPAQFIKDNESGTAERIKEGPKRFFVHGVWETKNLQDPQHKNKIDAREVKNYELSPALKSRINKLVPQMSKKMTSEEHLKKEFNKHGPNILCLPTLPEYITFALDVYERYKFDELMGFVAKRVEEEGIGNVETFYGMPWVGVRLGDLLRIIHSYPQFHQFSDAVGVQLLKRSDRLVLYEIAMCFTKTQAPARRCDKTPEVYVNGKRDQAQELSHDSTVLIIGNNVRYTKGEVGECSTSKSSNLDK